MKACEVIKKENEGKKYICRGKLCEVAYNKGFGAYLLSDNEPLHVGEWVFGADFEEVENKSDWDNSVKFKDCYYHIDKDGLVDSCTNWEDSMDKELQDNVNMFASEEKANEVAKEQLLYRLMKRFRDENDEYVNWMKDKKTGYFIYKDVEDEKYRVSSCVYSRDLHTIYFTTLELAKRCLDKVVKPFFENNLKIN